MLQVSLNEKDGTQHIPFALLLLILFIVPFLSSYFFPHGLTPRREKLACPTPLNGLQLNPPPSKVIEAASMPNTKRIALGYSLKS